MFKNRFILIVAVLSLLLVTLAVSRPFSKAPASNLEGVNDFYQRNQDWNAQVSSAGIPVTGAIDLSDYYQRYVETSSSTGAAADASDYFVRHPELRTANTAADMSDYFLRH
jgi:hypothetical protein